MSGPNDDREGGDAAAPGPAEPSVTVAGFGLLLYVGCRLIEIFLEAQSMAASVGQAVLVEWGSSRLGVAWSEARPPMTATRIAQRAGVGAVIGLVTALALFGVLVLGHGIVVESGASVEVSVLAVGLISAALVAWRDEMLLHGVTLRSLGGSTSDAFQVVACGITSAGAAIGRGDATPRTVFSAFALGLVSGALWVRDRGAWQPWAASTTFRFAIGTLLSGGLVDSRLADDGWAGGAAGMLGGTAATVALTPLATTAVLWTTRRISPTSGSMG